MLLVFPWQLGSAKWLVVKSQWARPYVEEGRNHFGIPRTKTDPNGRVKMGRGGGGGEGPKTVSPFWLPLKHPPDRATEPPKAPTPFAFSHPQVRHVRGELDQSAAVAMVAPRDLEVLGEGVKQAMPGAQASGMRSSSEEVRIRVPLFLVPFCSRF